MRDNNGSGGKRLLRLRDGRMVAGVSAGIAAYFKVDVNLVRLGFGVFTVFYGLGALIYAIAWAILPDEETDSSILESFVHRLLTSPDRGRPDAQDAVIYAVYVLGGMLRQLRRPPGHAPIV